MFIRDRFTPQGVETFRIIDKGNVWFSAVMVRGLAELYAIDGNAAYLGDVQRTLDYAWEHARDAQRLFETDFTGADKQSEKWLLTQGAMAEMYGRMKMCIRDRHSGIPIRTARTNRPTATGRRLMRWTCS